MSIAPKTLAAIAEAIQLNPSAAILRSRFPDIHFTECSEDDVSPRIKPVMDANSHLLFLVTGRSGHCLEFTPDLEHATGVVVASKVDEE